ncbi:MAG: glycine betaine ABC transporter substrate-binding protein [Actinomycetota bacterium]|nr:glycine betaine ABC transporter substrate-binding protein [Actinomycetota bacterium]
MLKLGGGALAGASLLGVAGCGSGGSGSSGANKTLNLGSIGWTENIAVANLTKAVFEGEMGYSEVTVEGPLELGLLFQGVADGDLHAFQDVWMPNHKVFINKPQLKNDLELLDPWYEDQTAYGLTAPAYMGVKSIADLTDVDTNEIIGIEPSATFMPQIENEVIPAYNLDMELVTSSTAGMLSALEKAYSNEEPIVFTGWSPHWMNVEYDFVYLEDPKNAQETWDDPAGVTAVVNADLKEDDPAAYAFLKALSLDEEQINQMGLAMRDAGTGKEAQGIRNWYNSNKDAVKDAVDAAKNA